MPRRDAPRRIDRQRRSHIIDAAIEVLGEHGLHGLRHRLVAAAADVPLGSTTYYFATLDDLLVAAMERAVEQDLAELAERFERLGPGDDIAQALAELLVEATGRGRRGTIVITELYTAALRNDALREVARLWDARWQELLTPHLGPLSARGISVAAGGIVQQALIRDERPSVEELRELIRALLPERA